MRRPCLRVSLKMGNDIKRRLQAHDLLDTSFKIRTEGDVLLLPLKQDTQNDEVMKLVSNVPFQFCEAEFQPARSRPATLQMALKNVLTDDQMQLLPRSYDLVGDIAVLEIPHELIVHERAIGEAFLSVHPNFTTVLAKDGPVSGLTRTREYRLLAGVDKTETIHTEYGCRIVVDLARAYFSPRLLEEHHRVASLVSPGETVIDMFTGVGPFALHIATQKDARVYAIDINESAIDLLKKSIGLNRLVGQIVPVVADAGEYVPSNFHMNADRVIMNHPKGASQFISLACDAVAPGGVIHYYDFSSGPNPEDSFRERVEFLTEKFGRPIHDIRLIRRVRDSAPFEYQMVADIVMG
ncbi:MAG: class I SAM-dependent methyltransferase family protein [Candidatus Thorarchaeota archaeon]